MNTCRKQKHSVFCKINLKNNLGKDNESHLFIPSLSYILLHFICHNILREIPTSEHFMNP